MSDFGIFLAKEVKHCQLYGAAARDFVIRTRCCRRCDFCLVDFLVVWLARERVSYSFYLVATELCCGIDFTLEESPRIFEL